jgi:serine/threonine protein kinase
MIYVEGLPPPVTCGSMRAHLLLNFHNYGYNLANSAFLPCGQNIIHRDIKLENILVMGDQSVKLADFGLAIDAGRERPVTRLGTIEYLVSVKVSNAH